MPIQSVGLLQACVPICMSGPSCKAAKPRSTPSANSFFTDGSCNSSPVLINIADDHLPRNQLPNHEIAFNIHTSQADHRDRGKRLRLPSCLLIETASNDAPAHPVAPCSRRFRCRLATIRPELDVDGDRTRPADRYRLLTTTEVQLQEHLEDPGYDLFYWCPDKYHDQEG